LEKLLRILLLIILVLPSVCFSAEFLIQNKDGVDLLLSSNSPISLQTNNVAYAQVWSVKLKNSTDSPVCISVFLTTVDFIYISQYRAFNIPVPMNSEKTLSDEVTQLVWLTKGRLNINQTDSYFTHTDGCAI
jgi:hypothetical protein